MIKRLLHATCIALAGFGVWATNANGDSYPSKTIRIIDGFPAGGSADYMARVIGPKLTERFGQGVVVENRPGAAGNLAADFTAHSNPDGHTLMLGVMTPLSSSRSLYPRLGYDLLKDFSYITFVGSGTNVLLAGSTLPARSVAELVALAKSKPKSMRYGSQGVASPGHLAMELLLSRTGMQLLHVPFKGAPPVIVALTGGEVDVGLGSVASAIPMLQAKRLTALAVTSAKRSAVLPDVPTVAESGFPGFDVTSTFGLVAPAGTPRAVVQLLNAEVRNILRLNDVRAKFLTQGLEAGGSTPEEFKASTEAEIGLWARVIRDAHITAN